MDQYDVVLNYCNSSFFLGNVVLHILLHRILTKYGKASLSTVFIFIPGFIATVISVGNIDGKFAIYVFYLLLVAWDMMFYTGPLLNDVSPASRILLALGKSGPQTEDSIIALFSEEELTKKRLDELRHTKLILLKNNRWFIGPKANQSIRIIRWYRSLLKWEGEG